MLVKLKPTTCMNCPRCASPKVVCGFVKNHIQLTCTNCTKQAEYGPDAIIIRQLNKLPKGAKFIGIYYGPWNKDEYETTEGIFRDIIREDHDFQDEWRFFKGRAVYTAWRYTWESGRLVTAPTLCSLLDQVDNKCRINLAR